MDSDSVSDEESPLTKQIIKMILKEFTPVLIGILLVNVITIFLVLQLSKRLPF